MVDLAALDALYRPTLDQMREDFIDGAVTSGNYPSSISGNEQALDWAGDTWDREMAELAAHREEVQRLRRACNEYERDAETILAPALGYPLYEPGSPGYTEGRENYDVADHCAPSLMAEAANALTAHREAIARVRELADSDLIVTPQELRRALDGSAS